MKRSPHLFVSPSGEALPRWHEAFPLLTVVSAKALSLPPPEVKLVWLRLDEASAANVQLDALRKFTGSRAIVVLANRPDDEEALALFAAGIRGYCNAHATKANLKLVAKVVLEGGVWVGESLMKRMLVATQAALSKIAPEPVPPSGEGKRTARISEGRLAVLTQREVDVAKAVASGASNKEIAVQLGITPRTVKAHVGAIFSKLALRDRLQLALIVNASRFDG